MRVQRWERNEIRRVERRIWQLQEETTSVRGSWRDEGREWSSSVKSSLSLGSGRPHLGYKKLSRIHYKRSIGNRTKKIPFKTGTVARASNQSRLILIAKWKPENSGKMTLIKHFFPNENSTHWIFLKREESSSFQKIKFEFTKKSSPEKKIQSWIARKQRNLQERGKVNTLVMCVIMYPYLGSL